MGAWLGLVLLASYLGSSLSKSLAMPMPSLKIIHVALVATEGSESLLTLNSLGLTCCLTNLYEGVRMS